MKIILAAIATITCVACTRPMRITANPDDLSATSGTLGSAKQTNMLPSVPDTSRRADTLKISRDTTRPGQ